MFPPASFQGPDAESDGDAPAESAPARDIDPLTETEGLDLVGILSSVDATAYVWDIKTGRIDWERNACAILNIPEPDQIATGAGYHALIAAEHLNRRLEAFSRSVGSDRVRGVPYRVQYRLLTGGRAAATPSASKIRVAGGQVPMAIRNAPAASFEFCMSSISRSNGSSCATISTS